jgi:hypothetical protein
MKRFNIPAILTVLLFATSCLNNDDQPTGVGDVIVVSKQSGNTTVYGISIYAYTFSSFDKVDVVRKGNDVKTFSLKANQGVKSNFYYETPDVEYSTTKPAAATYEFTATFSDGSSQKFEDLLTDKVLPVPTVEKCAYNATNHRMETEWAKIENVNSYAVNILEDNKLVFASGEIPGTYKNYSVRTDGGGWAPDFTPENGKTYIVRIFAYQYESPGNGYNVQATSYAERSIVWGN